MRIDRRVMRRKDQYLLTMPAEIRHHLGVVAGARVWWHTGQKGMAAVTNTGRVVRGRLKLDADCPSCQHYRQEITALRAKLPAQRQSAWQDAWRHYVLKKLSVEMKGLPVIESINNRLRGIEYRMEELAGRRPPARPRRGRAALAAVEDHVNGCPTCLAALVERTPGAKPCSLFDRLQPAALAAAMGQSRRRAQPTPPPDPSPSPVASEARTPTA